LTRCAPHLHGRGINTTGSTRSVPRGTLRPDGTNLGGILSIQRFGTMYVHGKPCRKARPTLTLACQRVPCAARTPDKPSLGCCIPQSSMDGHVNTPQERAGRTSETAPATPATWEPKQDHRVLGRATRSASAYTPTAGEERRTWRRLAHPSPGRTKAKTRLRPRRTVYRPVR
jgi:hypothetical protein